MKDTLVGAAIAMTSSGSTMIAHGAHYGGWLMIMGIIAGLCGICLHISEK